MADYVLLAVCAAILALLVFAGWGIARWAKLNDTFDVFGDDDIDTEVEAFARDLALRDDLVAFLQGRPQ